MSPTNINHPVDTLFDIHVTANTLHPVHKKSRRLPAFVVLCALRLAGGYFICLWAFLPFDFDNSSDRAKMHKKIGTSLAFNESIAFFVVEPFYGSVDSL